jgi:hypothetical protein
VDKTTLIHVAGFDEKGCYDCSSNDTFHIEFERAPNNSSGSVATMLFDQTRVDQCRSAVAVNS